MKFRNDAPSWRQMPSPVPRWVLFLAAGIAGFALAFVVGLRLARGA